MSAKLNGMKVIKVNFDLKTLTDWVTLKCLCHRFVALQ
jgi:hypothetical protein